MVTYNLWTRILSLGDFWDFSLKYTVYVDSQVIEGTSNTIISVTIQDLLGVYYSISIIRLHCDFG